MNPQRLHLQPHHGWQANRLFQPLLVLLVLALGTSSASALDRALHLHATSHGPAATARLASTDSRHTSNHGRGNEAEARRAPSRQGNRAEKHAKAAPGKATAHNSSRRRHAAEPVDVPVTLHRAAGREAGPAHEPKPSGSRYESQHAGRKERQEIVLAKPEHPWPLHNPKVHHQIGAVAPSSGESDLAESTPSPQSEKMAANVETALRNPKPQASGESHPESDGDVLIGDAITTATPYHPASPDAFAPAHAGPANESIVSSAPSSSAQLPQPKVIPGFAADAASSPDATPAYAARPLTANNLAGTTDSSAAVRALADEAVQPMVLPIYTRSGELMMPAPLKGSHEILVHQNIMADHDGLERIRNDRELNRLRAEHVLVNFPDIAALRVNESLPENRRYARPWTVKFAADAARAFYARFSEPLIVSSAVRTVSYQLRLERVNGNAAAVSGDGASPHLTGQAIDLAKRSMTSEEIAWMRTYLAPFMDAGKIDVEEEFQQACFHISVYRAYLPAVKRALAPKAQVAQLHAGPRAAAARDANDR